MTDFVIAVRAKVPTPPIVVIDTPPLPVALTAIESTSSAGVHNQLPVDRISV